jgi:hypothetical protein
LNMRDCGDAGHAIANDHEIMIAHSSQLSGTSCRKSPRSVCVKVCTPLSVLLLDGSDAANAGESLFLPVSDLMSFNDHVTRAIPQLHQLGSQISFRQIRGGKRVVKHVIE